jgi:hypothetical protein
MPDLFPKIIIIAQAGNTKERRPHIDSGLIWQLFPKEIKNSVLSEGD